MFVPCFDRHVHWSTVSYDALRHLVAGGRLCKALNE